MKNSVRSKAGFLRADRRNATTNRSSGRQLGVQKHRITPKLRQGRRGLRTHILLSSLRDSIAIGNRYPGLTPGATAYRHFVAERIAVMAKHIAALILISLLFVSGCGRNKTPDPLETTVSNTTNEDAKDLGDASAQQRPGDEPSAGATDDDRSDSIRSSTTEFVAAQFPPLAPLPDVPVPADNPISEAKAKLGKLLFFDNRLSGDLGTSCASCHDPRLGWGDGQAVSRGYAGTQHWRNSQTTVNAAFYTKLFWAGEVPSLEAQAKSAATGNLAGNGDPVMIEERIAQIPEYLALFREAFGVDRPTFSHVLKAIATFERVEMISRDSPFDQYLAGDEDALSEDAKLGLALFQGKAGCIQCHNGALMSDEDYHYLDLPQHAVFETDPLRQVALRYQHYIRGVPEDVYRNADDDLGLYYTTKKEPDKRRFRTPALRYLEYTAPYMHNGVFSEIEEVIEYYNSGGGDDPSQSPLIRPLGLTEDEKFTLAEFLYSLSGREIRMNVPKLPEYKVMENFVAGDSN